MTREEAKAFYPILQAFAEGKVIETRTDPNVVGKGLEDMNDWTEMNEIEHWNNIQYRVKPESTYRPFKDAEECWNEMQKHQPFGWVRSKKSQALLYVKAIGVLIAIGIEDTPYTYKYPFDTYTFVDGTPFGIKVED